MLKKEDRKALPKKRANRAEIDAFYYLAAARSGVMTAEENLKTRAKMVPGGGGVICAA